MAGGAAPVSVLELQRNGCWDSRHFKLQLGCVLRFTLAPSLYAKHVELKTDYPAQGTLFQRDVYRTLQWKHSTKQPHWDPDRYVDLLLDRAGPFRFKYESGQTSGLEDGLEGSGFFIVDPNLGYSPDGISCQTWISKLLGPLSEWHQRLQTAAECGYNMIHLTPIQQLGSSRSAYSISNQLRIDSTYLPSSYTNVEKTATFVNPEGKQKKIKVDSSFVDVRKILQDLHQKSGILSLTDVVWNHTSFDTPWLLQHPEAGYNLLNSPHLRPAYALDATLAQFSREVTDGKWMAMGISPEITHEDQIHSIASCLMDTVLPRARLWEFFCVDIEAIVSEFRSTVYRMNGGQHPQPQGMWLEAVQDKHYRRLGSGVDIDLTLEMFNIEWPGAVCFEERIERCCTALREELRQLNQRTEDRVHSQLQLAVNNMMGAIRYEFLDQRGPRRVKPTHHEPLVPRHNASLIGL